MREPRASHQCMFFALIATAHCLTVPLLGDVHAHKAAGGRFQFDLSQASAEQGFPKCAELYARFLEAGGFVQQVDGGGKVRCALCLYFTMCNLLGMTRRQYARTTCHPPASSRTLQVTACTSTRRHLLWATRFHRRLQKACGPRRRWLSLIHI